MKIYKTQNIRLKRILYGLGWDYEIEKDETGYETFCFDNSDELQESIEFYLKMRRFNNGR